MITHYRPANVPNAKSICPARPTYRYLTSNVALVDCGHCLAILRKRRQHLQIVEVA